MINTSKSGNPWGYLDRNRPRNIVFYGRVSTEHEAQLSALENQMQWYDDQLRYHPNWTVVGKYIDEGITGTQAKKRPAFLRMLEDARAGKFDLIVTREVCRFARNTVDTLVHTRELKNIGVEVYFVEDNIWTMDGDGELRLSLMATLAQEESRKVSERVRAGQKVSREKGTLYGSGNILGYERVGDTYVINPDQAETVRMIFEMYLNEGLGTGKIANRLTEMGRLNASGLNKWSHGVVSRVLNNQTYMGMMAYGKSYNNNYLDQKRINNRDKSSYICVEGAFPPIVTPEEWYRAQEIKAGRVKESFSAKKGKKTTHCVQENRDLWGSRLRCTCGCGFRKNVWHKYDDKPNTYGYQCYNILNNGSANQRRKAGADDTGYCDQPMIADWKLELMGKKILELVFQDKRDLIDHTCDMIRKCLQTARPQGVTLSNIVGKMERIKFKLLICECGHTFNTRRWDRADRQPGNAYQCYSSVRTGSYESRKKKGLPLEGICRSPMIPEWRLQMMANLIFRQYLSEKDKVLALANSILEAHIGDTEEVENTEAIIASKRSELERLNRRMDNYIEMRADGDLSREQFRTRCAELEPKIQQLQQEIESLADKVQPKEVVDYSEKLTVLQYALEQYTNINEGQDVPESVIEAFVVKIVVSKDGFDWYLRFDGDPDKPRRCTLQGKRKTTTKIMVSGENSPTMDSSPTGCAEVIGKRKFLIAQHKIMTAHGVAPWAVLYIRKIVVDSWLFWLY